MQLDVEDKVVVMIASVTDVHRTSMRRGFYIRIKWSGVELSQVPILFSRYIKAVVI